MQETTSTPTETTSAAVVEQKNSGSNKVLFIILGVILLIICCIVGVFGAIAITGGALFNAGVNQLDRELREQGSSLDQFVNDAQNLQEKTENGEDVALDDVFGLFGDYDVPENFPNDIPLLSNYSVTFSSTSESDTSVSTSLSLTFDGKTNKEIYDSLLKDLASKGWDVTDKSSFGDYYSINANKEDGNRDLDISINNLLSGDKGANAIYDYTEYF